LRSNNVEILSLYVPNTHPIRNGGDYYFSRDFDNNKWVYSFLFSHDLFAVRENSDFDVFRCKSIYAKRTIKSPNEGSRRPYVNGLKERYLSLIFDPWRNVFYRVFLPEVEVDDSYSNDEVLSLIDNPRVFSVIILDENLNVIGETLMKENSYNPEMFFVNSAGLFFALHFEHPEFELNFLKFAQFDLLSLKE
jgi:hypothetical protein